MNYADVRAEIENDTKAVVRDDMGVSNIPINLTIYSPHGKKHVRGMDDRDFHPFVFSRQSDSGRFTRYGQSAIARTACRYRPQDR